MIQSIRHRRDSSRRQQSGDLRVSECLIHYRFKFSVWIRCRFVGQGMCIWTATVSISRQYVNRYEDELQSTSSQIRLFHVLPLWWNNLRRDLCSPVTRQHTSLGGPKVRYYGYA